MGYYYACVCGGGVAHVCVLILHRCWNVDVCACLYASAYARSWADYIRQ